MKQTSISHCLSISKYTLMFVVTMSSLPATAGVIEFQKLQAESPVDYAGFGQAVAISGTAAIISEPGLSGGLQGSAYIYQNNGSGLWEQTELLVPDAEAMQFARSVDLNRDLAIASSFRTGNRDSQAYIYRASGDGNWNRVAKLNVPGMPLASSNPAVAIDGNIAIVGQGVFRQAQIFREISSDNWVNVAALNAAFDPSNTLFGDQVALSGNVVVVSGNESAYVFEHNGSNIWSPVAKLIGSDGLTGGFGSSLAIDGDRIIVSASGNAAAYIFERGNGGSWSETAKLTPDVDGVGRFGFRVALSDDIAVISSEIGPFAFKNDGIGNWIQQANFMPSDPGSVPNFETAVDVSGDTLIAGMERARIIDENRLREVGAAYLYHVPRHPVPEPRGVEILLLGLATLLAMPVRVSFWGTCARGCEP